MNIIFLDIRTIGYRDRLEGLREYGSLTFHENTVSDEVYLRSLDADIIVTNKVKLSGEVLRRLPRLKLVCIAATGTNNVALDVADELGIVVKNVTDYSTHSVIQGTFAMLLYLINKINYYDRYVKEGDYARSGLFTHFGRSFWELNGKRFGIIGLGNIGKGVAKVAESFGCEVVYYSTSGRNVDKRYPQLKLKYLLMNSDIVSIHAPLNSQTRDLIDYEKLQWMKDHAILLNLGRGGIVNERDLARAIDEELIAGAGIDVYCEEPIGIEHPYLMMKEKDKIVLTPHSLWASDEARSVLVGRIIENISEFIENNRDK